MIHRPRATLYYIEMKKQCSHFIALKLSYLVKFYPQINRFYAACTHSPVADAKANYADKI